jgi:hypothetical protein
MGTDVDRGETQCTLLLGLILIFSACLSDLDLLPTYVSANALRTVNENTPPQFTRWLMGLATAYTLKEILIVLRNVLSSKISIKWLCKADSSKTFFSACRSPAYWGDKIPCMSKTVWFPWWRDTRQSPIRHLPHLVVHVLVQLRTMDITKIYKSLQRVDSLCKGSQWSRDPCLAMQDYSRFLGRWQGLPRPGNVCKSNTILSPIIISLCRLSRSLARHCRVGMWLTMYRISMK